MQSSHFFHIMIYLEEIIVPCDSPIGVIDMTDMKPSKFSFRVHNV
jgi:hypothetical protein